MHIIRIRSFSGNRNGWKRGASSDSWDTLYIHAPLGSLGRIAAKIARDCARAVMTIPLCGIEDAQDDPWMEDLSCMTPKDTQLPTTMDVLVDTRGSPLLPPATCWTTLGDYKPPQPEPPSNPVVTPGCRVQKKGCTATVAYMDGFLAHPDRDMAMACIMAAMHPEGCTILDHLDRSITQIMPVPALSGAKSADGLYCPLNMVRDALSPDGHGMVCEYIQPHACGDAV